MNHFVIVRLAEDGKPKSAQIVAGYVAFKVLEATNWDGYIVPITPHWSAAVVHPAHYHSADTEQA